ncbi:methyltransferase domain-containing protein [Thalassospira sp. GB04J01]|uniref:methyltransferase domain-containing protein n=1 Tax=Thalassospira sp. GB04J01 TaxID=1485225 RepID=UPI000C9B25F1|nr:methyltransferase domain-containing protein [Thalassospira sp. GB04J01]|tara:strand:+ start:79375 stop:80286 length:912 start_codon:yes stop_codon:yes gene_type:complete
MADPITVFDRHILKLRRDRAASRASEFNFLFAETADRLADRLEDTTRSFPRAVDLGCHSGELAQILAASSRVETLHQADISYRYAKAARDLNGRSSMVADEEFLPFAEGSLDLILSNLSLHWVNDLPGMLLQARRALKSDGLFLASMLGGETLKDLREALMTAEAEEEGGVSPRVSPFVDVKDAGALLQRSGFALPVVDADDITIDYPDALKLMRDLSGMGESNIVAKRSKKFTKRSTLARAAAIYHERHGRDDGRVHAKFQVIYLTGWAPDESQPKPLRRGSGQVSLVDFLGDVPDKPEPKN